MFNFNCFTRNKGKSTEKEIGDALLKRAKHLPTSESLSAHNIRNILSDVTPTVSNVDKKSYEFDFTKVHNQGEEVVYGEIATPRSAELFRRNTKSLASNIQMNVTQSSSDEIKKTTIYNIPESTNGSQSEHLNSLNVNVAIADTVSNESVNLNQNDNNFSINIKNADRYKVLAESSSDLASRSTHESSKSRRKSKGNKNMFPTEIEVKKDYKDEEESPCPVCSNVLLQQERIIDEDRGIKKKLPPYCFLCKSYIVSESSDETERDILLQNLAEWMTDVDEEDENHSSVRPFKGPILVILDNKSISTQKCVLDQKNCNENAQSNKVFINPKHKDLPSDSPPSYPQLWQKTGNSETSQLQTKENTREEMKQSELEYNIENGRKSTFTFRDKANEKNGESTLTQDSPKMHIVFNDDNVATRVQENVDGSINVGNLHLKRIDTKEEEEILINDYQKKRNLATKVIGNKLMLGYTLTQIQCEVCGMPIMERMELANCVVCPHIRRKARKKSGMKRLKQDEALAEIGLTRDDIENKEDKSLSTPRHSNVRLEKVKDQTNIPCVQDRIKEMSDFPRNDTEVTSSPHQNTELFEIVEEEDDRNSVVQNETIAGEVEWEDKLGRDNDHKTEILNGVQATSKHNFPVMSSSVNPRERQQILDFDQGTRLQHNSLFESETPHALGESYRKSRNKLRNNPIEEREFWSDPMKMVSHGQDENEPIEQEDDRNEICRSARDVDVQEREHNLCRNHVQKDGFGSRHAQNTGRNIAVDSSPSRRNKKDAYFDADIIDMGENSVKEPIFERRYEDVNQTLPNYFTAFDGGLDLWGDVKHSALEVEIEEEFNVSHENPQSDIFREATTGNSSESFDDNIKLRQTLSGENITYSSLEEGKYGLHTGSCAPWSRNELNENISPSHGNKTKTVANTFVQSGINGIPYNEQLNFGRPHDNSTGKKFLPTKTQHYNINDHRRKRPQPGDMHSKRCMLSSKRRISGEDDYSSTILNAKPASIASATGYCQKKLDVDRYNLRDDRRSKYLGDTSSTTSFYQQFSPVDSSTKKMNKSNLFMGSTITRSFSPLDSEISMDNQMIDQRSTNHGKSPKKQNISFLHMTRTHSQNFLENSCNQTYNFPETSSLSDENDINHHSSHFDAGCSKIKAAAAASPLLEISDAEEFMKRHTDTCEYASLPSQIQNSGKDKRMERDENVGKMNFNEELYSDQITPSTEGDCYDISERLEQACSLANDFSEVNLQTLELNFTEEDEVDMRKFGTFNLRSGETKISNHESHKEDFVGDNLKSEKKSKAMGSEASCIESKLQQQSCLLRDARYEKQPLPIEESLLDSDENFDEHLKAISKEKYLQSHHVEPYSLHKDKKYVSTQNSPQQLKNKVSSPEEERTYSWNHDKTSNSPYYQEHDAKKPYQSIYAHSNKTFFDESREWNENSPKRSKEFAYDDRRDKPEYYFSDDNSSNTGIRTNESQNSCASNQSIVSDTLSVLVRRIDEVRNQMEHNNKSNEDCLGEQAELAILLERLASAAKAMTELGSCLIEETLEKSPSPDLARHGHSI